MRALLLALLLLAPPALAQVGQPDDCSGTVGVTATVITYPRSGATGPTAPNRYVTILNPHASNTLYVNPTPGGTAAAGTAGSAPIAAGGGLSWWQPAYPPPARISIVASGADTPYTCWYQ